MEYEGVSVLFVFNVNYIVNEIVNFTEYCGILMAHDSPHQYCTALVDLSPLKARIFSINSNYED